LLAFFAPSFLAVVALLVRYLAFHTPFVEATPWDVNPVDVVVLRWIRDGFGYLGLRFDRLDEPGAEDGLRAAFDQVGLP
jgi:hypothetical protein